MGVSIRNVNLDVFLDIGNTKKMEMKSTGPANTRRVSVPRKTRKKTPQPAVLHLKKQNRKNDLFGKLAKFVRICLTTQNIVFPEQSDAL